ncbi:dihydroneopterin aldolase [Alteromonas facilis]|uniref:dihydroneopterin aldolase n=1 Tax=Alteromonas facilis TaxID=2048004 RepID=UPI000C28609E|nr:dihydroneopterin aldolase [Alteromonas facilis]
MEQIIIQGLQLPTLIGVYDWERTQKTILLVDLVLDADLSRACETDDVADTIDYAKVAEALAEVAGKAKFELLEALGQALCDCVLTRFPVTRVDLSIIKPDILPNAAKVAVRLVRESR